MRTFFTLFTLLMQISLLGLPGPESRESIALRTKLLMPTHNYTLKGGNFADALVKVAGDFQIPMGIEWVRTPSATREINFLRTDATVQEIIEGIVKSQPGYQIEIRNAVIHVVPLEVIPSAQNFLNLKVGEFEARNEVVEIAEKSLREIVKTKVSPPKPVPPGMRGGIGSSLTGEVGERKFSLKLRDVAVSDILDAFSLASGKSIWVVSFAEAGEVTPTGYRRTVTLWNNMPIPDDEQPVWDTLHWGQALPTSPPSATH